VIYFRASYFFCPRSSCSAALRARASIRHRAHSKEATVGGSKERTYANGPRCESPAPCGQLRPVSPIVPASLFPRRAALATGCPAFALHQESGSKRSKLRLELTGRSPPPWKRLLERCESRALSAEGMGSRTSTWLLPGCGAGGAGHLRVDVTDTQQEPAAGRSEISTDPRLRCRFGVDSSRTCPHAPGGAKDAAVGGSNERMGASEEPTRSSR
jgi:hypothetical protein